MITSLNEHEAAETLRGMRAAARVAGYGTRDGEWRLDASYAGNGLTRTQTIHFDTAGRFERRIEHPLGTIEAFDGTKGWRTDMSGIDVPLELGGLARAKLDVYVTTGLWLFDPALLEVVSIRAPGADDLELTLRVAGTPIDAVLVVDRERLLPRSLRTRSVTGESVRSFEAFDDSGPVLVPGASTVRIEGHVESRFSEAHLRPAGELEIAPPPAPEDTRFDGTTAEVPLRFAPTGHLLVEPLLGGERAGAFIFDSGAGQSGVRIDPPESLGLERVGQGLVSSIFGVAETPLYRGESFGLGPLHIDRPIFHSMDLAPFTPVFGEPVGGIVGFDVLRRSVVEVDLAASSLRIHDPASYAHDGNDWLPLRFQDNHPIIPATIEGRPGLFRLDLGASGGPQGNVVMHAPGAREGGYLDDREMTTAEMGDQEIAVGIIESLEVAGKRFTSLEALFAIEDKGLMYDPFTTGNIGVDVLAAFHLVFDYGRRRIALTPRSGD